jgi:hypothetical protein
MCCFSNGSCHAVGLRGPALVRTCLKREGQLLVLRRRVPRDAQALAGWHFNSRFDSPSPLAVPPLHRTVGSVGVGPISRVRRCRERRTLTTKCDA